jgi:hypothetical protein
MTQNEYKHKVKSFIQENQFVKINKDPTQKYQRDIKQTLKQNNSIIQKEHMEVHEHEPHATIKLHK